jgi:hypothetical protein
VKWSGWAGSRYFDPGQAAPEKRFSSSHAPSANDILNKASGVTG